jgi:hypothetical protein
MRPRLDILPAEQQRLWPELSQLPEHFVLYGGTAVALRLGGRQSVHLPEPAPFGDRSDPEPGISPGRGS